VLSGQVRFGQGQIRIGPFKPCQVMPSKVQVRLGQCQVKSVQITPGQIRYDLLMSDH